METAILLATSRTNTATVLCDAAAMYKVDTNAITLKVKQDFTAKTEGYQASAQGQEGGLAS